MNPILNNPYHVIGVLANSSVRETHKQQAKFSKYLSVGKEIVVELDNLSSHLIKRESTLIEKAKKSLESVEDRVFYALFWYINNNSFDDIGIASLNNKQPTKALETWKKTTESKAVNERNISSKLNLSSYYLHFNDKNLIANAIETKIEIISSSYFQVIMKKVGDEFTQIKRQDVIYRFIDTCLTYLKSKFTTNQIIEMFHSLTLVEMKYLKEKLSGDDLSKVNKQIERFPIFVLDNKSRIHISLNLWLSDVKINLEAVKKVFGSESLEYKDLTNQVVKLIKKADIESFNYLTSKNKTPDYKSSIRCLKVALEFTTNHSLVAELNADIEDMKKRESQAVYMEIFNTAMDKFDFDSLNAGQCRDFILTGQTAIKKMSHNGAPKDVLISMSDLIVSIVLSTVIDTGNASQAKENSVKIEILTRLVSMLDLLKSFNVSAEVSIRLRDNTSILRDNLALYRQIKSQESSGFGWLVIIIIIIIVVANS